MSANEDLVRKLKQAFILVTQEVCNLTWHVPVLTYLESGLINAKI
jgi:hypothetical protein